MPNGRDSRFDKRRLGTPRPTPYFELGDSPEQVAADWNPGEGSALHMFSRTGRVDPSAVKEVDSNMLFGDIDPREKERLRNLKKHLEGKLQGEQ